MLKAIQKLCTPAYIYLICAVLLTLGTAIHNADSKSNSYKLGAHAIEVPHLMWVFLLKVLSIGVVTVILDALCRNNCKCMAWVASLFAVFILIAVLVLSFVVKRKHAAAMIGRMRGANMSQKEKEAEMKRIEIEEILRARRAKEEKMAAMAQHEEQMKSMTRSA